MNLQGKTAIVTGGGRGIGRAVCLELARGGADIVLCYTGGEATARQTAGACEALGVRAAAVRCDVSEPGQVARLAETALHEFGRIDILVNNAGITRDGLLMSMKEEDFDQVLATNLKGTFLCMKAVSRQMVKQRYGRIVNLSSVVGLRGNGGQVNYAASKAGVGQRRYADRHSNGKAGRGGGCGEGRRLSRQRRCRLYHRTGAVRGRRHGNVIRRCI